MEVSFERLEGKRVLVVGMARSGVASANLLGAVGAKVIINDRKTAADLQQTLAALKCPVEDRLGEDPAALLDELDMIVLSPAVSLRSAFAQEARRRGIEVIGEIELGYRYLNAPIVCVTGTNGKTTTTALTGEIFKAAGRNTYVLGNIGLPIAEYALEVLPADWVVAEVAGFQLESTERFHPRACAFLNLTEDHLDRFKTMDAYLASKVMVFKNQTAEDFAILNADDPIVAVLGSATKARVLYFSRLGEVADGAFILNGNVIFRLRGEEQLICPAAEIQLPGAHNLENALAAVSLAMCMSIDAKTVAKVLKTFKGVEHRIEFVRELHGVQFFNDSKGTNPDSTVKAIETMDRPTVLILGGYEKNSDFLPLFEAFNGRIKYVVAVGDTAERIVETAGRAGYAAAVRTGSFKEAVAKAYALAARGDSVLLSPASASYDMFDNFEQRGEVFKTLVNELK